MTGLFFLTLWAGYLGWQWRRTRTIQNEINELKKQFKPSPAASEEATSVETPRTMSPVEAKIQQLTEERKGLLKGSYRDRHFSAGSLLLGFGVLEAVGGGLNTWIRTGKLFPGPHLFGGAGKLEALHFGFIYLQLHPNVKSPWTANSNYTFESCVLIGMNYECLGTAITVLRAAAAALVPQMQKGNEAARNIHIALNVLNLLHFACQTPTGIDIVFQVFKYTDWP